MRTKSDENILLSIWGISLIATAGSLFYSEIRGFTPCELCWVSRIFMYPLVLIYGVALWKKNLAIALPAFIASGMGVLLSIYHYLIQNVPIFQGAGESCGMIPCHTTYVNYFGFVTIPFMAGMAFVSIFVLHYVLIHREGKRL